MKAGGSACHLLSRWQYVPPKRWLTFSGLHGIISQNIYYSSNLGCLNFKTVKWTSTLGCHVIFWSLDCVWQMAQCEAYLSEHKDKPLIINWNLIFEIFKCHDSTQCWTTVWALKCQTKSNRGPEMIRSAENFIFSTKFQFWNKPEYIMMCEEFWEMCS
jgi:hypothetical protein